MSNMVVINGVRYREQDAKRLGLLTAAPAPTSGATVTANSQQVNTPEQGDNTPPISTNSDGNGEGEGESTPPPADTQPAATSTVPRPAGNGSKADWTDFALANGKTEADLQGLTRDDIAALFPAE